MLTGITDFYHFTPLVVTLTLAGGDKFRRKGDLVASFSSAFQLIRMKISVVLKQFKLNILILFYFLVTFVKPKEITAVLLTE